MMRAKHALLARFALALGPDVYQAIRSGTAVVGLGTAWASSVPVWLVGWLSGTTLVTMKPVRNRLATIDTIPPAGTRCLPGASRGSCR